MKGEVKNKKRLGDDGEWIVEVAFFIDGAEVSQAEFDTAFPDQEGVPGGNSTTAWPIRSDAMAVHSKQIPAVLARNKRHGLNIPYDRMGRPILADAGQRRALMKLEGVRQMNSYYGA